MEYDSYRKAITPHIDLFKKKIDESKDKCVRFKIKDICNEMGSDFTNKHDNTIYSRLKDILLENGIKVRMGHLENKDKLLIMENVRSESEIITTADVRYNRGMITGKKQGLTVSEYTNKCNLSRYLGSESENKSCPLYFGDYIEKKYVMQIFEDPIPFEYKKDDMGRIIDRTKPYDYICKNGFKLKHIASCKRTDKFHVLNYLDDILYWGYLIRRNNVPDYYILSAWDDRNSLNPLYVWIIRGDEIFITQRSQKPFWDRYTFVVYDTRSGIDRMSKYEVGDKLEQLREVCKIARKKE